MVRYFSALLVLVSLVISSGAAHAGRIGVASVVKNQVNGSVAGVIRVGTGVAENEVISTGAQSSTQLLFRDETSLTIGPQSRVTLDRFVYNPATRSGDVVVNVARGTFRFVSGSARPGGYTIKTPAASIGLRGTVIEGFINALGELLLVVVESAVDVITANGTRVTVTAGQYVTVTAAGVLTGPATWTGRTLDIESGQQFILDTDNPVEDQRNQLNDALDSRDIELQFPKEAEEIRGGGSQGGGGSLVGSDVRLKRDIRHVATLDGDLRLYAFRYLWSDEVFVGVMAQDLIGHTRFGQAVVAGRDGFYRVDYAALGLRMVTLDEWKKLGKRSVLAGALPPGKASVHNAAHERE